MINRLVYESVSLTSHILRSNVGAFKIDTVKRKKRRKSTLNDTNSTVLKSDNRFMYSDYIKDMHDSNNNSAIWDFGSEKSLNPSLNSKILSYHEWSVLRNHYKNENERSTDWMISNLSENLRNSSLLIRDMKDDIILSEDDKVERERLFFEIKNWKDNSDNSNVEERLQNIISSSKNKYNMYQPLRRKYKWEFGRFGRFIDTGLKYPTQFGAFRGSGYVMSSGVRAFDFLLLDFQYEKTNLVPVLKVVDTSKFHPEVSY